ncbi:uncharacterized protein METZ01_LOCUS461737 [marine metagenome]|uniref:Uncharacterized protein n=1 Tax=marine metagenome TaxID=408172 RepID=A0A383AMP7_9ZZZZ
MRQISASPTKRGETFDYEVVETSDAKWACGQVLDRSYVRELCKRSTTSVRIISGD